MRTFLLIALACLPWSARAQQPVREALQRQIFERLVENYRTQAALQSITLFRSGRYSSISPGKRGKYSNENLLLSGLR